MNRTKKIRISALAFAAALLLALFGAPLSAAAVYELPADVSINAQAALVVGLGRRHRAV